MTETREIPGSSGVSMIQIAVILALMLGFIAGRVVEASVRGGYPISSVQAR